ncbi:MAG: LysM peptidoglycan-binding domain-containing protein [Deltaproteobacteria bacterium]|nr:LysM peptidoglycan-binding domain-containing protein [Deltaproteobacteria bacterium]
MSRLVKVGIWGSAIGVWVLLSSSSMAGEFKIGGSAKGSAGVDSPNSFKAQGSVEENADSENAFYQRDVKPGITTHAPPMKESALSIAARNRTSISIGATKPTAAMAREEKSSTRKVYTVQNGDTLWDICNTHFGDPYVWPRIWSYNPEITNPNWIYPGDTLWLVPPMAEMMASMDDGPGELDAVKVASARQRADAILSRNRGFVDKKVLEQSGVVSGAQRENSLLSQYDEAYVAFEKNRDVQVGDEFAAFRILKEVNATDDPDTEVGKLVEILGSVRVTSFNKKDGIARVVIDESLHPIERGTMIGPVHRRFDLVPSKTNQQELKGTVVAHLDPTLLYSQHQIVFVDKGHEDGVREGNRFFVIKQRDFYRESLGEKDAHEGYPFEVLAELRVLEARPNTSTCIVTGATRALEDGADVEMVKGY